MADRPGTLAEALPGVLISLCPASIWLLGGAANCNKPAGHDGNHEVKIEWVIS